MPVAARLLPILAAVVLVTTHADAQTLRIGPGGPYRTLEDAAPHAQPGDTLLFTGDIHTGGAFVSGLRGRADAWITLRGEIMNGTTIRGGTNAFQLSDAAYVRISDLMFDGQTGNGVNIDDGGSYETPAHHITIERCTFRALNATGNNDQLKLSGVDTFAVRDCRFFDGSAGGSCVDMVGCHMGIFERNLFSRAGSNSIQAKGGCDNVEIRRNRFAEGGQRALNVGGSTGAQYFRPPDAGYEARRIRVHANIFTGATVPVAFVGAVDCEMVNNTVWKPGKWVLRILQETVGPQYAPCGNNQVVNNIFVVDAASANPAINIGPNTAPETFRFSHNLWWHSGDPSWAGPNLPVAEEGGILHQDPRLSDPSAGDFRPVPPSPAIGSGEAVALPVLDFDGRPYRAPRTIGASEAATTSASEGAPGLPEAMVISGVYPHPASTQTAVLLDVSTAGTLSVSAHDLLGRQLAQYPPSDVASGRHALRLDVARLPRGLVLLRIALQSHEAVQENRDVLLLLR